MIGIGAVVIASAAVAGAVAAGILGPRLHQRRMNRGRMGTERRPGFGTASGDASTALGPLEAKRNTGQVLPGSGA